MQQKAEDTAVYKLFHWKYQCRIPESVVYGEAVLESFGTFVSGNEGRDVSNATMLVGAIRTIAELAEIHSKGFKLELPDNKKAFEIYKTICDHLKDAIEFQKNGMFGRMPPIKDLECLDKFAAYIYPQARWHFVGEHDETSTLMSFLAKRSRVKPAEKAAPEAHKSITSKISAGRLTGSRAWK
jgi:hypothetical protein